MCSLPSVFDYDDWRPFAAAWLRAARKAGWRVGWRELAAALGCAPEHLRGMRRGRRRLGRESAMAMANALGLGMAETWQLGRLAALDYADHAERPVLLARIEAARQEWRRREAACAPADARLAALQAARDGLMDRSPQQREIQGLYSISSPAALPRLAAAFDRLMATVQSYDHRSGSPVTCLAYVLPLSQHIPEIQHAD